MGENDEEMINELRKIVDIYVRAAGDLVQEIDWIEQEFDSNDPIEYRRAYLDSQFKYRKTKMERVTNLEEAWNHEQEIWEKLIDMYTPDEEES